MPPARRSSRKGQASTSRSKSSHSPTVDDGDSPAPEAGPVSSGKRRTTNGGGRRVKEEPSDSLSGDSTESQTKAGRRRKTSADKDVEEQHDGDKDDAVTKHTEDDDDDDDGKAETREDDGDEHEGDGAGDEHDEDDDEHEGEGSETRCPCGSALEDIGWMIQCEKCKTWQHGPCMGYAEEPDAPEHYYCELCRPDMHPSLPAVKPRHRKRPLPPPPVRTSRSHSPNSTKQPKSPKRRNTMNSRDAMYDEELRHLLYDEDEEPDPIVEEVVSGARRNKRKRASEAPDTAESAAPSSKRHRSDSTASEAPATFKEPTPVPPPAPVPPAAAAASTPTAPKPAKTTATTKAAVSKDPAPPPPPPAPTATAVGPRGGKKRPTGNKREKKDKEVKQEVVEKEESVADNDRETPAPPAPEKPAGPPKKTAAQLRKEREATRRATDKDKDGGYLPTAAARRKAAAKDNEGGGRGPRDRASEREQRESLKTPPPVGVTWALPDWLSHLAHVLPSDTPQALVLRGGAPALDEDGEPERGVRVKWPSKRMTIGDMNKRVRNIVEFVAREQAGAEARARRVDALAIARAMDRCRRPERVLVTAAPHLNGAIANGDVGGSPMDVDAEDDTAWDGRPDPDDADKWELAIGPSVRSVSTEAMMSDLMNDLILFQEMFGMTKASGRVRREGAPNSTGAPSLPPPTSIVATVAAAA
ncbi:hypothetical protein BKA62DRAFT_681889 [Auriculariales sp. MPI-PUGE-AT-0066]|nr:hypothetical protein BKA62DRAFT_681889 [Auriculariales sp. MPI-PUGE-AT-0066]